MSATYFEAKDIKSAKAKCKDEPWFKLDASKTRKNKNKQQPTYYIPFTAKNAGGKRIPLALKFNRQLIASNAKIPYGVSDEEARDVRVSFRELNKDDLEPTDYEESKRESLLTSNKELIEALGIIADEYLELVDREVLKYKGDKFKLNKNKTVNCFRQTHRDAGEDEESDDKDEDGKIPLPYPIFRIKVPADPETKKIGFNSDKTGHIYVVFDMKKTTADAKSNGSKKPKPVVAKIKTSKGFVDLTVTNAKHFITYMSLTTGMILFDSVCISKSGVSLMCRFKELHVWKHRTLKVSAMDEDTMNDMAEYGAVNANGDDDEVFDEPEDNGDGDGSDSGKPAKGKAKGKPSGKPTKNAKSKTSAKALSKALDGDDEENQVGDDEPDENDAEEPDENAEEPADEDDANTADADAPKTPPKGKAAAKKTPPKLSAKKDEPAEEEPGDDDNDADAAEPDSNDNADDDEANEDESDEPAKPAKAAAKPAKAAAKPAASQKGASLKAGTRKKE